jgi:siderophore synthetase component
MATTDDFVFERELDSLGRFALRPLSLAQDAAIVHDWVTRDYAHYWGQSGQTLEQVVETYRKIECTAAVFLGFHRGEPAFLVECYRPEQHAIGDHYAVQPGDRGMHVLVGPATTPIAGFTWSVFTFVMDFLFSDPAVERIVVEPDIRNRKIHALNRRAGFRYQRVVALPAKHAHLAFCTRAQYWAATGGRGTLAATAPQPSTDHLTPDVWKAVNRGLIRKAVSEFAHERLLAPECVLSGRDWNHYRLRTDLADVVYSFRARRLALDHWDIDSASIAKSVAGRDVGLDALELVLELKSTLELSDDVLPVYLEEIASTLFAAAYKRTHQAWSAADLVHADFQEIEAAMTDGHPAFVANSGRVGFDATDYRAYAPETAADVRLIWLAAHRRHAEFSGAADLDYAQLMREELGPETLAIFQAELVRRGVDADQYFLLPVHPWQWFNKLALVFAPDIAARDLICLDYGPDTYRAQQSIRTFFNLSAPHKRYVKTALSVLNMGFMRGLSADYMRGTPAINDWIHSLIAGDPFFSQHGFSILREVAAVGYRNRRFEDAVPKGSPYRKMLAALWRESPVPKLAPGEHLMTMAALLHRDRDGVALLPQLILASGLEIGAWLDRYLACYLAPLLHCFYHYDLVFMPHGENLILAVKDGVPVRAFMKDIGEEAAVLNADRPLPAAVERLRVRVSDEIRTLSISSDVFDGILRFIAQILFEQAGYAEDQFWQRVGACLEEYFRAWPEHRARLARFDLFARQFPMLCLNRIQLRNNRQMVDLADPAKSLQFSGVVTNPVAAERQA